MFYHMAARYQQAIKEMYQEYQELFDSFRPIHDAFALNQEANKDRFNLIGKEVLKAVQETERKLCSKTEGGMYSKYSMQLADKFRAALQKDFPKIFKIGMK